jgi:hypothetical protein
MSGTFPTTPVPAKFDITSRQRSFISFSHTFKRRARSLGGHRWEFKLEYNYRERAEIQPLLAFLVAQRGQFETFQIVAPTNLKTLGVAVTAGEVVGGGQTGRTVVTGSWPTNETEVIKAGDFIKFNTHSKVYMVTQDVISDAIGSANVQIEPALFESPNSGDLMIVSGVEFTMAMQDSTWNTKIIHPQIYSISFGVIEIDV